MYKRHCFSLRWNYYEIIISLSLSLFSSMWYNRRKDEGKSYKRKEMATNAKWCNQQVLWRAKERGGRQKLVEEKGVINLPSGRKPKRNYYMS